MPNYFVTFRAHSAEPQVFEDWMILLLKIIKRQKNYAYQIEWDETPSRHIHLLLYDKIDISKIHQLFNNKQEKLFKKFLEYKLTVWDKDSDNKGFCNIICCDDKDPLSSTEYYLGYIHKHNCPRRGHSVDITSEIIHDAVMLYYTNKKLSKRDEKNNDIKLITSKNIYSNLISFVNDPSNETSFSDKSLKYKTIVMGEFGYANISDNAEAKAFTELRIMKGCEQPTDKLNCLLSATDKRDIIDPDVTTDWEAEQNASITASRNAQKSKDLYNLLNLLDSGENFEPTLKKLKKKYPNFSIHENAGYPLK